MATIIHRIVSALKTVLQVNSSGSQVSWRQIAYALFEARIPPHVYFVHVSGMEAALMHKRTKRPRCHEIILKLPDLDHAKSAVLNSLSSPHSRRNYKFAMEQFISWYCSEPRLALNRTVVQSKF